MFQLPWRSASELPELTATQIKNQLVDFPENMRMARMAQHGLPFNKRARLVVLSYGLVLYWPKRKKTSGHTVRVRLSKLLI